LEYALVSRICCLCGKLSGVTFGKCSARIEAVSNQGKFDQTGRKIKQIQNNLSKFWGECPKARKNCLTQLKKFPCSSEKPKYPEKRAKSAQQPANSYKQRRIGEKINKL